MMKRGTLLLTLACGLTLVLAVSADPAWACPNCRGTIENTGMDPGTGQASGLPHGFNSSIYAMLTGLCAVLGAVVGMIVRTVRSTDARNVAPAPPPGGFAPNVAPVAGGAADGAEAPAATSKQN